MATNTWIPKTNSLSSEAEQLKEIRGMVLNQEKQWSCDRRDDPLIFWKPVPYDPRFPNIDITKYDDSFCFFNVAQYRIVERS